MSPILHLNLSPLFLVLLLAFGALAMSDKNKKVSASLPLPMPINKNVKRAEINTVALMKLLGEREKKGPAAGGSSGKKSGGVSSSQLDSILKSSKPPVVPPSRGGKGGGVSSSQLDSILSSQSPAVRAPSSGGKRGSVGSSRLDEILNAKTGTLQSGASLFSFGQMQNALPNMQNALPNMQNALPNMQNALSNIVPQKMPSWLEGGSPATSGGDSSLFSYLNPFQYGQPPPKMSSNSIQYGHPPPEMGSSPFQYGHPPPKMSSQQLQSLVESSSGMRPGKSVSTQLNESVQAYRDSHKDAQDCMQLDYDDCKARPEECVWVDNHCYTLQKGKTVSINELNSRNQHWHHPSDDDEHF